MKNVNNDEILCEVYRVCFNYLDKSTNLSIKFYEDQYKMYEKLIVNHLEVEPSKIFKTKHIIWEEELNSLNDKHDDAFRHYLDECNELYQLHSLNVNMT